MRDYNPALSYVCKRIHPIMRDYNPFIGWFLILKLHHEHEHTLFLLKDIQ